MKYVIIGAKGQLGQEFAKLLSDDRIIALDIEEIDVSVRESVETVLGKLTFDAVINLAAFHNVNGCEDSPDQAFAVNATGAYNVAEVAGSMGKKVAFFSSDYVFGGDTVRSTPYTENDHPAPLSIYGASKVAGENLVRAAQPDNHLIIRSSSLFGCVTSKKGWTFPELMLRKARAGDDLKVVDNQIMAPTYTYDLASRVLELFTVNATGTFHVVNSESCSWYEFACATFDLAGLTPNIRPVSLSEFPAKARRPEYSVLSSVRIEEINLSPLQTWREALNSYLVEKGEI